MKKKAIISVLAFALVLCIGGVLLPKGPALLENGSDDIADSVPAGAPGELMIADSGSPMADAPRESAEVADVRNLVNESRQAQGLSALELDPVLCQAARVRAEECGRSFSHTRPDGRSFRTAVDEVGGSSAYTGENVADGYTSPSHVMSGWLNSDAHRANILHDGYTKIGIAMQKSPNRRSGYVWVQIFSA